MQRQPPLPSGSSTEVTGLYSGLHSIAVTKQHQQKKETAKCLDMLCTTDG